MTEPKPVKQNGMWAVFAPDGEIQMRSIAYTRKDSQYYVRKFEGVTWEDYKAKGFYCRKVDVTIKPH